MRKLVVLNNVPCILAALFLLSFAFSCSSGRGGEAMDIEVVPTAGVLHFSDLYDGCGAVVPQGPMLRGIVDVEIVDSTMGIFISIPPFWTECTNTPPIP